MGCKPEKGTHFVGRANEEECAHMQATPASAEGDREMERERERERERQKEREREREIDR